MRPNSLLKNRVRKLVDESDYDDSMVKSLILEMEGHLDTLLASKESPVLYYEQGYVAALRSCIEKVRYENKKRLLQNTDDVED